MNRNVAHKNLVQHMVAPHVIEVLSILGQLRCIVVPTDQHLPSIQPMQDRQHLVAHSYVPKMIHLVSRLNDFVPVVNHDLVHFGCCESHHKKWHLIRRIPNLRKVSVSPWTSLAEAVEEIGGQAILNWRVNNMNVVTGASPDDMRAEIREGLRIAGGRPIEIILQDLETVYGKKDLLKTWVDIAKEEAGRQY